MTPSLAFGWRVVVVMAREAGTLCGPVIEDGNNPIKNSVASRTIIAALEMSTAFAFGRRMVVVVAGIATATHIAMIEIIGRPICNRMTCCAVVGGLRMTGTLALGWRMPGIMTREAGTKCGSVIKALGWLPDFHSMAILAGIRGAEMACRFSRCRGAVVATEAASGNTAVIKECRLPAGCSVA